MQSRTPMRDRRRSPPAHALGVRRAGAARVESDCCSRSGAARHPGDRRPDTPGSSVDRALDRPPAESAIDDRDALARIGGVERRLQLRRVGVGRIEERRLEAARSRPRSGCRRRVESASAPSAKPVSVTLNEHAAARAWASLAAQLTAVVPRGNADPGAGLQVTVTGAAPPVSGGRGEGDRSARSCAPRGREIGRARDDRCRRRRRRWLQSAVALCRRKPSAARSAPRDRDPVMLVKRPHSSPGFYLSCGVWGIVALIAAKNASAIAW